MADIKDLASQNSLAKPTSGLNLKPDEAVTQQPTLQPEEDYSDLASPVPIQTSSAVEEDYSDLASPTPIEEDYSDLAQPTPTPDTGLIEDITTGLQRSVAPMTMTREELRRKGTWTQFGAQIAGDIASSVAAMKTGAVIGASVGGPAGAAAGAVSGAVLYGIYKGTAEEQALATAEDREFDPLSAALGASVEIVPATPGSRFIRAAMQGVASSADTFYKSEDTERAVVAGLLGAGLTGLVAGPNATPKSVEKAKQMLDHDDDLVPDLLVRAHEKLQSKAAEKVSDDIIDLDQHLRQLSLMSGTSSKTFKEAAEDLSLRDRDFVRHVIQKPSSQLNAKDLQNFQKKVHSPEELNRQWDQFKRVEAAEEAGVEYSEELARGLEGTRSKDPLSSHHIAQTALRKGRDVLYAARRVDENIGTNFEGATSFLAKADRQFKTALLPYQKRIQKLQGTVKDKDRTKAAQELKEGLSGNNTDAEEMRAIFDDIRELARQEGYDVGHIDNYFPTFAKEPAQLHVSMQNAWNKIKSKIDPEDVEKADLKDLIAAHDDVEFLDAFEFWQVQNKKNLEAPITAVDIQDFIDAPVTFKGKGGKTPELGIMFERKGELPEFMREQDPIKALYRYARSTINAVYKRPAFEMLDEQIAMARGAGLDESVLYFENYKNMLSGDTGAVLGKMYAHINRFKAAGIFEQQEAHKMTGVNKIYHQASGQTKELVYDLAGWSLSQAYNNLLGWNLYAPIRNMSQTWLMTVPELTQNAKTKDIPAVEAYAHSITAKGWVDTAKDKWNGMNLEQDLIDRGLSGPAHFGEGTEHLKEGLEDAFKGLKYPIKLVETVGNAGMFTYGKSDAVNRAITLRLSRRLASDFESGHKIATEIVNGMPKSVRQRLRIGEEQTQDILADYLLSATQFNYGREGLNEFGREYGRAFTMFTKWPIMLLSDLEENMRKSGNTPAEKMIKGSARFGRKHLSKLALLYGMDSLFEKQLDTPAGRVLFNKGFAKQSPVMAVTSLPVPLWGQVMWDGAGALAEGIKTPEVLLEKDFWKDKASKLGTTIRPLIPGEFLYRAPERLKKQLKGD